MLLTKCLQVDQVVAIVIAMTTRPLTAEQAADALCIKVGTLYGWLEQSDVGELVIRGENVTINYLQGGARGQGRIFIDRNEIERIKNMMRVQPVVIPHRRQTINETFEHITVALGRPD